jgi:sugar lactone lactonase YvrE
MFITSAREGLTVEQRASDATAGALFVCEPGATGGPPRTFAG